MSISEITGSNVTSTRLFDIVLEIEMLREIHRRERYKGKDRDGNRDMKLFLDQNRAYILFIYSSQSVGHFTDPTITAH